MPIQVLCPKCRSRFNVSDKFAGQSGPCPKCKAVIQIPKPTEEVKVHAPEEFAGGGRSTTGKLITKPIPHANAKFRPMTVAIIGAGVLTTLAVAWIGGPFFRADTTGGLIARIAGLLVVTPPLIVGAYNVLRDDELEPHRGRSLWLRVAICTLSYIFLWGLFDYLADAFLAGELWNWLVVLPPVCVLGSLAALATLDLDFGSGFFHFAFYFLVTVVLRWVTGMGWIWDIAPAA